MIESQKEALPNLPNLFFLFWLSARFVVQASRLPVSLPHVGQPGRLHHNSPKLGGERLFLGSVAAAGGDGPQEKEEGAGERRLLAASHAPAGASPAVSCPVISHPFQ